MPLPLERVECTEQDIDRSDLPRGLFQREDRRFDLLEKPSGFPAELNEQVRIIDQVEVDRSLERSGDLSHGSTRKAAVWAGQFAGNRIEGFGCGHNRRPSIGRNPPGLKSQEWGQSSRFGGSRMRARRCRQALPSALRIRRTPATWKITFGTHSRYWG